MYRRLQILFISFVLFISFCKCSEDHSLETCLQKDSISCVQIHIYKKLRALFSQETIDLLAGFRIIKNNTIQDTENKARSDEENIIDGKIYETKEITERQFLLENFLFDKVTNFFKNRSIQWNVSTALEQIVPAARKFFSTVPANVKHKLVHYVTEGRGKKKFMRFFFPVIIAFKMTVFTWVKVIYLGVALIAKKALLISMMALIIAIFVAFKKYSYKEYRQPHYEYHGEAIHSIPYPVSWPSGGHTVHAIHGHDAYDMHAAQSSPSHYLAYAAQKPNYV